MTFCRFHHICKITFVINIVQFFLSNFQRNLLRRSRLASEKLDWSAVRFLRAGRPRRRKRPRLAGQSPRRLTALAPFAVNGHRDPSARECSLEFSHGKRSSVGLSSCWWCWASERRCFSLAAYSAEQVSEATGPRPA